MLVPNSCKLKESVDLKRNKNMMFAIYLSRTLWEASVWS